MSRRSYDDNSAHDVLAADEFAVGAADPSLEQHPFVAPVDPNDPTGRAAPHDVLAAEEFAMPAPRARRGPRPGSGAGPDRPLLFALGGLLVSVLVRVRSRRRG